MRRKRSKRKRVRVTRRDHCSILVMITEGRGSRRRRQYGCRERRKDARRKGQGDGEGRELGKVRSLQKGRRKQEAKAIKE